MKTLKVNTIYPAFMGEVNTHGIGAPCTFVRLAGCNLRCYFKTKRTLCDTPEALEMKGGKDMSVSELAYQVKCFGRKVVCLTGGEPLMQDVLPLLVRLSDEGMSVVVETNGSMNISPYRHIKGVSFVVDVKSPSSGEKDMMDPKNYALLDEGDFVKFVLDTQEDFNHFYEWVVTHDYIGCNIAVGLFWGSELSYLELMQRLNHLELGNIYLNMQTHKMACMYDYYKGQDNFSKIIIPKDV